MAFIRKKTIKGKEYAYFVDNRWLKRKKAARQRVSKYLGRVVSYDVVREIEFSGDGLDKKADIIKELASHELMKRGFERKGKRLEKEGIVFDLETLRFYSGDKELKMVVEMNEGFLCKQALMRVMNFKSEEDDEHVKGIHLAKAFLEAGLDVPKDVFVAYFEKV